jgi:hypothetical protein
MSVSLRRNPDPRKAVVFQSFLGGQAKGISLLDYPAGTVF